MLAQSLFHFAAQTLSLRLPTLGAWSPPSVPKGGVTTLLINLPHSPKTCQSCSPLIRACFREKRPHRRGCGQHRQPRCSSTDPRDQQGCKTKIQVLTGACSCCKPSPRAAGALRPLCYNCPAQNFFCLHQSHLLMREGR